MSYTGATPAFKCLFFIARDQGLKMTTNRTQITARKCTKLCHLFQNFHGEASPRTHQAEFRHSSLHLLQSPHGPVPELCLDLCVPQLVAPGTRLLCPLTPLGLYKTKFSRVPTPSGAKRTTIPTTRTWSRTWLLGLGTRLLCPLTP